MGLITPDFGLFFWMLVAFGLLAFLLGKFAWKPIMRGLNRREESIAEALDKARAASEEVARLEASNAQLLRDTQAERDRLVAEARETRERILEEARHEAERQAALYVSKAREQMRLEEAEVRRNLRCDVARIAVAAAEAVLREHFTEESAQAKHIDRLVGELMPSDNMAT